MFVAEQGIDSPMLIFAYIELCRYGYGFIRHGSQTCVAKKQAFDVQ